MLIYAHRGASHDFPELTMAAYKGAVDQGADGFECDLRLTRDLIPVLWHDDSLERVTGVNSYLSELTYAQVKAIYPAVLTLDEFLTFAISSKKSVLLETKHPNPTGTKIEEILIERLNSRRAEIEKSGIEIAVMSFSWNAIEKVKVLNPSLTMVFLLDPHTTSFEQQSSSAQVLGPEIVLLRKKPEIVMEARKSARKVYVWTVDDAKDIAFCQELGVDILATNRPAHARKVLGYP